jgi:hypothetical protein
VGWGGVVRGKIVGQSNQWIMYIVFKIGTMNPPYNEYMVTKMKKISK